MYSGVAGMRGFQTKLDVISNNISNVNTVGFKGSRVMFQDMLSQTMSGATAPTDENGGVNPKQVGLGSTISAIETIYTQGSALPTGVTEHLRISGDGFFLVAQNEDAANDGEFFLTRDGDFKRDAVGNLVNSAGMMLLDSDLAPIVIDPEPDEVTSFTIEQNGTIRIVDGDGEFEDIGQIGIAKVTNPGGLEKVGGNLYRMTTNANLEGEDFIFTADDSEVGTGEIISGELEMSNVDMTQEFTEMIIAQRGFQANSRVITTSDEMLQEVVNLK